MAEKRIIYFHEDDYCQQQLLPRGALAFTEAELKKSDDFAAKHLAPDGQGWTDMYIRQEAPAELVALNISKEAFISIISTIAPPFDEVYEGYLGHGRKYPRTAAWGNSQDCALFAEWNIEGIIVSVWTSFFERDENENLAATNVVAALGDKYPLIYVDWAWSYICEASDRNAFSSRLRTKLETIDKNLQR